MLPPVDVAGKAEGLRERRRREVRGRLRQAAYELLRERDVESVRADEIANLAGVSRATFFNYYASKADLLTDLGGAIVDELERLAAEALEQYEGLPGALAHVFSRGAARIQADEQICRQLIDHLTRAVVGRDERARLAARTHAVYRSLLERAAAEGELAEGHDLTLLSELVASAATGILTHWFNDPTYPLASRLVASIAFFTRALRTPA